MTSVHTSSSTFTAEPFSRRVRSAARASRTNTPLFIAIAIFLGVLAADAVLIAAAAPSIATMDPFSITAM